MEDERSYKLHGLGHLTTHFRTQLKTGRLRSGKIFLNHYGLITGRDIEEKYSNFYAISQLNVTFPTF